MDPIWIAIAASIAAVANKVGEQFVVDAKADLKELPGRNFGPKSKVTGVMKELEVSPRSAALKAVVKKEVALGEAD